jgi:hypothetical protein
MSTSPTSLSSAIYNQVICKNLSSRLNDYMVGTTPHVGDKIPVVILKNMAFKVSMIGVIALSPIEFIAKTCLGLIAYSFYSITLPIETLVKTPYSLYKYGDWPVTSISNKIYQLSYDLLRYNLPGIGYGIRNLILARNQLYKI